MSGNLLMRLKATARKRWLSLSVCLLLTAAAVLCLRFVLAKPAHVREITYMLYSGKHGYIDSCIYTYYHDNKERMSSKDKVDCLLDAYLHFDLREGIFTFWYYMIEKELTEGEQKRFWETVETVRGESTGRLRGKLDWLHETHYVRFPEQLRQRFPSQAREP